MGYTCRACALIDTCKDEKTFQAENCKKFIDGNTCSYCKGPRDSSDPAVLCAECREDFGHTMFDEL